MDRLDLDSQGKLLKKIAYPRHSSLLAPTTVDAGPHHLLETAVVHVPAQVVEQLTSHAENTFHRCRGGRAAQELARHLHQFMARWGRCSREPSVVAVLWLVLQRLGKTSSANFLAAWSALGLLLLREAIK